MERTKGSYSDLVGRVNSLRENTMKQLFKYSKGRKVEVGEKQYSKIILDAYKRNLNDLKNRYLIDNRGDENLIGRINDYIAMDSIQNLK